MLYFKFPFQDSIFSINNNSENSSVSFHDFLGKNTLHFRGNLQKISLEDFSEQTIVRSSLNQTHLTEETQEEYLTKLDHVVDFIKENELQKLVISRRKLVSYSNIDFNESFLQLVKNYPNAFVYLFRSENTIWMGAFSELLGKFNKNTSEFETMSLAGTVPLNEDWTSKEIEEQKPVTDYIKTVLQQFSVEVKVSSTYDHISGNIKHLRTDFSTKVNAENLEKLITQLHPTPAVCGIPKDFCQKAIQQFEKYPREFYAGYSRVETEDEIYYFVNLRCGKFYSNGAELFVGGGITKDSDTTKEWRETELKAEALLKNLKIS